MINFEVSALCIHLAKLRQIEDHFRVRTNFSHSNLVSPKMALEMNLAKAVTDEDRRSVQTFLDVSKEHSDLMHLPTVAHRVEQFSLKLKQDDLLVDGIYSEARTLLEAFQHDLASVRFHIYSPDSAKLLCGYTKEWMPTILVFKAAANEIDDALNCYATNYSTAAVFHLMRIAEHGLRALAKERKIKLPKGKPVEWGTWQDILKEVKSTVETIGKTKRPGPGKDDALSFYNGAIAHFEAFKDQYRNLVMHVRKRYEPWEALIALNHVRDFMNGLSLKITEDTKGPIRWRF